MDDKLDFTEVTGSLTYKWGLLSFCLAHQMFKIICHEKISPENLDYFSIGTQGHSTCRYL